MNTNDKIYVVVHAEWCDDIFEGTLQECKDYIAEQDDVNNLQIQPK